VSGFYHKLYENKTSLVQRDLSRLNKLLDRHNFFDCETILELQDPSSSRKALLIQSEMDVVADGSDGDRAPVLDDSIAGSDYYQPSTSYFWKKQTPTPNPLLARWQSRLDNASAELAKGPGAERSRSLKALISQLKVEIEDMKAHSSLIADSDPFIVISLLFKPYVGTNEHAPQMGDYAVVIHNNQILPAICGDYGPTMKMGEASLFLAKQVNAKSTPYNRSEEDLKVTYLIFPGTAKKPFAAPNLDEWHKLCTQYLNELGGVGPGYEVHAWQDKFKRPDFVGPPVSAMMPRPADTPADKPKPADSGDEEVKKAAKVSVKGGGKKKKS
ncbi:MAG: Chitosanase of glycosyl hydrolase group 75, partial [Verrucomicrobiaceae bacterium]|nr:Chitosanase of glycosyl hydrolase group 75 [Verrucomicrobiaceae bacterium]